MKSPKNMNLYSRLSLITSVILITGYLIVSATWTSMNSVGTGDQLSATLWNTFVGNLNDLDIRLKSTASTWPTVTGGIAYTGGNVGIGTTSPGYPLDIVGLVNTQGALGGFRVAPRDGIGTSFSWYNPTGDDFRMYASAIGDLFTVQMNGNVGIGTTDPGAYRTAIRGSDDTSGTGALWVSGAAASNPGLMVRNDGNVGIGTATPSFKLQINDTDNSTSNVYDGRLIVVSNLSATVGSKAGIGFMNGSASTGGIYTSYLTGASVGADMGFWTRNATTGVLSEKVRITNDGNVGIGTASPAWPLHVSTSIADWAVGIINSNASGYGLYIKGGKADGTTQSLHIRNVDNIPLFNVLGNGNVGIGTASPYAKVHSMGQTFMMGSTTDLVWGSVGSVFQGEFGAASGNTYTKLESFIAGGSAYGDLALNPGGGSVVIGTYETGGSKLKVIQPTDNAWTALIKSTSPTAGLNFGLTIRAGTSSADSGFSVMDKTSTNYQLYVQGDGNIGIGTKTPGNFKLKVDGGPFAVTHGQNTNSVLQVIGKDAPSAATFLAVMASGNGADNEFLFQSDGTAKADGTWNGGGADYAEWFEKEGEITGGALIGLNTETGKVRTWQKGDTFIGIQSLNPGFVGNNIHGAETEESEMIKTHVLVALVGQVEVKSRDIIEQGRRIMTSDGQFIGLRLSNGNVFIK